MGKNHRHTKKLKSEKNKIHIKSKTKFLPKGQNVTDTSFKIRPIIIQEQLKDKEAVTSSSKKKVNIEELIAKLRHFNDGIRSDSCQDLKDLILQQNPDVTQKYLSSILQNLCGLIQDRDRKVRRSCIKLLNVIFEKVSVIVLRPLATYILTNLKCAMTNINKNIQEDSLLLLDALLEHQSLLISENFDDIFPNFLMLISKLKNQNTTERSLSLNLEGKVTSVKWRVKVLTRLYGILKTIVVDSEANIDDLTTTINAKETNSIPIYKKITNSTQSTNLSTEFNVHILNLVQLLHEIWMEIVPEKASVLPNQESVAIFSCLVHILRLLEKYKSDVFTESKCVLLLDCLIRQFPYTHNKKNLQEITKEISSCFHLNNDHYCTEENLIILYIFIKTRLGNLKQNPNKSIGPYLNNCLKLQNRLSSSSITYLIKTLKLVLPRLCRKLNMNEAEIIESVSNFYTSVKIPNKDCRNDILDILTNSSVDSWIKKLPDFLASGQVSSKLIDTVLDLCRKRNETVQNEVRNSLKLILDNLPSEVSMNFVSIFYYLPDVEEIEHFIQLNPGSPYVKHFQNVLELRAYMNK